MGGPTRLERARLGKIYRQRLGQCFALLLTWANHAGLCLDSLVHDLDRFNDALANFVQYCADTDIPHWRAKHAVLACQVRWRCLKGKLFRPWDALKAWELQRGKKSRRPMPIDLLHAMVVFALASSLENTDLADLYVPCSILALVGFHALLRPAEIVALTVGDLMFQVGADGGLIVVIALTDPKNRRAMGASQFALIRHSGVAQWLRWFCAGLPRALRLWPASYTAYNATFKAILAHMGLTGLGLTAGSLRPGGTTYLYINGKPVGEIKYMGRWRSETSLSIYVQEAMAYLVWLHIPVEAHKLIRRLLRCAPRLLAGPPITPWVGLFSRRRQWSERRRKRHLNFSRTMQPGSSPLPLKGGSMESPWRPPHRTQGY